MPDFSFFVKYTGFIAIFLVGCQAVNDLQPAENALPESVVEVLKAAFPTYKEITVSTLEKSKVWSARLWVDTTQYDVILNRWQILSKYRRAGDAVPAGFKNTMNTLLFRGGAFSSYKIAPDYNSQGSSWDYAAHYLWNGKKHWMRWNQSTVANRSDIYMYPGVDASFLTKRIEDLPDNIQKIIQDISIVNKSNQQDPENQSFIRAWVYLDDTRIKHYEVYLSYSRLELDAEGQVHYYMKVNLKNPIFRETLPAPVKEYLQTDPLTDAYQNIQIDRYSEDGREVYRIYQYVSWHNRTLYIDKAGTVLWYVYQASPEP